MTPSPHEQTVAALNHRIGHYENFPVASWLCPPALRPAVAALYHFARTADDLADEGDASAADRLVQLAAYRRALSRCLDGAPVEDDAWPEVFVPLGAAVQQHTLPGALLHDLISAFEQDVHHTATGHVYADLAALQAYCRYSANPVGRLLLHLYGFNDPHSLAQSDAICSALQLINFWQDLSEDLPRQRFYVPADALQRHGLRLADLCGPATADIQARGQALVADLCAQARALMGTGAPLALRVPGRAGWELRLVVQGGLRILDHIASIEHRSWQRRPRLRTPDLPRLLWRAWTMGARR
ncbi:MAG: squalene synthase HpnC [Hydrogenophaga sp.]